MSKLIIKKVEEIIDNLHLNEFDLVDIEYVKENSDYFLRIYFDKKNGLTLYDCEELSKIIGDELDKKDFIKDSYYLEISSPGLDRPLKKEKDFLREKGKMVDVKFYSKYKGNKELTGILNGLDKDGNILLICDDEKLTFAKKDVAKINLHIDI